MIYPLAYRHAIRVFQVAMYRVVGYRNFLGLECPAQITWLSELFHFACCKFIRKGLPGASECSSRLKPNICGRIWKISAHC